jgi:hypothetical protein
MATITGQITVDEVLIIEVSGDPSITGGTPAPTGSIALDNTGKTWTKFGPLDTEWSTVSSHESLAGLLGGAALDHYHLTGAQAILATQNASTSLTGLLTSTDWNIFNNKSVVNKISQEVDFGIVNDYVVVTILANWISSTSVLHFSVTPNLIDHDVEDALLEGIKCTYGNIVDGVSFDLHVHAPEETSGRYIIKILGM